MANIDTLTTKLSAIGDAIREKTGKEETMTLDEMPTEIEGISGGGTVSDIMESLRYLNYTNRINDMLPKKITLIKHNPSSSRLEINDFLNECTYATLNDNVKELVLDISEFSLPSASVFSSYTPYCWFDLKDSNSNYLPKITINNPNNVRNGIDSNDVASTASLSSTTDGIFVGNSEQNFILELKDVEFIKQFYTLLGYKEGVIKRWPREDYNFYPMILRLATASNPQVLLDNFQFDTKKNSSDTQGLSYHNVIFTRFFKWMPGCTFYNVHIDRGDYTTTDKKFFYSQPDSGLAYNFIMSNNSLLNMSEWTWETDENNQPLVLTNIANQTLPLFMGGFGLGNWTLNGIKNFLRTLPDTSQGEGNNVIQYSGLSNLSDSPIREYFSNMPEEDIASLSDRGWSISIS